MREHSKWVLRACELLWNNPNCNLKSFRSNSGDWRSVVLMDMKTFSPPRSLVYPWKRSNMNIHSINWEVVSNYTKLGSFWSFQSGLWSRILPTVLKLNDWRSNQINWDDICQKLGQEKWPISDIWWALYVARIKFRRWHHEKLVGGWCALHHTSSARKSAASSVTSATLHITPIH